MVCVEVELVEGRYDAGGRTPIHGEWPPHPARLFCALVASAVEDADWVALEWLERQQAPEVWACPVSATGQARSSGWVVTNEFPSKAGSQGWPGRTNGRRRRASVFPEDAGFAVVWPDAEPADGILGRLMRLARRVPYVGRATSPARVSVFPDAIEVRPGWVRYQPVRLGTPGAVSLRSPYTGYVEELRGAELAGRRAWECARSVSYAVVAPDTGDASPVPPESVAGPFADLLCFGIRRPSVPVAGCDVLPVTEALRLAVMGRVGEFMDPVPGQVSGHGADDATHLGYVGLLDVGGTRHADGHLLGLGVAIPESLRPDDRRALLRALLGGEGGLPVRIGPRPGQVLNLEYRPERTDIRGLVPERWTGGMAGARVWTTASPIMVDRYPEPREDVVLLVAEAVATSGYPPVADVEILSGPAIWGGIGYPRRGTIPPRRPRRHMVHCRIRFATPVVGPVMVGALRYLGVGLLVPDPTRPRTERRS